MLKKAMPDTAPDIQSFTLQNSNGISVELTNSGASITSINVPDLAGTLADAALGFKRP